MEIELTGKNIVSIIGGIVTTIVGSYITLDKYIESKSVQAESVASTQIWKYVNKELEKCRGAED